MLTGIAWACIMGAAICGVGVHRTDRQLQRFRQPDLKPSSYWFIPLRDRTELYTVEGRPLVRRFWRLLAGMYGLFVVGAFLLVVAAA
jgi:hypothetical protein